MWLIVLVLFLIVVFGLILGWHDRNPNLVLVCLLSLGMMILGVSVYHSSPKAIDVYRGNTELMYDIINGDTIDTIVVFKEIKK